MGSVFIKVPVSERLPNYGWVLTPTGGLMFIDGVFRCPHTGEEQQDIKYWLEEIELPTEEEACQGIDARYIEWQDSGLISNISESAAYKAGLVDTLNFILDKLKGGNNG